jgi:hypothetical protein
MDTAKFLPFDLPQELQIAVDELDRLWTELRKTESSLANKWLGYGISLTNPLEPSIIIFLQNDTTEEEIDEFKKMLPPGMLPPRITILTGVMFTGIPSKPQRKQGRGIPAPGNELDCRAEGGTHPPRENGTLGAFIGDANGVSYILSANHVLAFNLTSTNIKVQSRGQRIGRAPIHVHLTDEEDNRADVAASRLLGRQKRVAIPQIALTRRTADSPSGGVTSVEKFGAGTKHTTGTLKYCFPRVKVKLPSCGFPNGIDFINQYAIADAGEPFANRGDSGSIAVLDKAGQRGPFGMLMATTTLGGEQLTLVTPFDQVLLSINDKLPSKCQLLI